MSANSSSIWLRLELKPLRRVRCEREDADIVADRDGALAADRQRRVRGCAALAVKMSASCRTWSGGASGGGLEPLQARGVRACRASFLAVRGGPLPIARRRAGRAA